MATKNPFLLAISICDKTIPTTLNIIEHKFADLIFPGINSKEIVERNGMNRLHCNGPPVFLARQYFIIYLFAVSVFIDWSYSTLERVYNLLGSFLQHIIVLPVSYKNIKTKITNIFIFIPLLVICRLNLHEFNMLIIWIISMKDWLLTCYIWLCVFRGGYLLHVLITWIRQYWILKSL